jgi:hypothetical protein
VEKRVSQPLKELCAVCNAPDAAGLRLWPAPGKAYTELDAIRQLSGAEPYLIAAGGIAGAEGGAYFAAVGTDAQLEILQTIVGGLLATPPFAME